MVSRRLQHGFCVETETNLSVFLPKDIPNSKHHKRMNDKFIKETTPQTKKPIQLQKAKFMKLSIFKCLAVFAATLSLALAEDGWGEDFEAAKAIAAREKKPILLEVIGKNMCDQHTMLERDVFSQKEFKAYAKDNLVLFRFDYPKIKPLAVNIEKQDEELAKKLELPSYPMIYLLDADGKKLGETRWLPGGAATYVEHLKSLLAKAKK